MGWYLGFLTGNSAKTVAVCPHATKAEAARHREALEAAMQRTAHYMPFAPCFWSLLCSSVRNEPRQPKPGVRPAARASCRCSQNFLSAVPKRSLPAGFRRLRTKGTEWRLSPGPVVCTSRPESFMHGAPGSLGSRCNK